jgi:hypothetical protein
MKRWIIAFLVGFCAYLITSIALATVTEPRAAGGIGFVVGIIVMVAKARQGRPGTAA